MSVMSGISTGTDTLSRKRLRKFSASSGQIIRGDNIRDIKIMNYKQYSHIKT